MSYQKVLGGNQTFGYSEEIVTQEFPRQEGPSDSSYRKVSSGGQLFEITGEIYPSDDAPILGKSFIVCPRCGNRRLSSPCNCEGLPPSYACLTCGWSHLNHRHPNQASGSRGLPPQGHDTPSLNTFTLPN